MGNSASIDLYNSNTTDFWNSGLANNTRRIGLSDAGVLLTNRKTAILSQVLKDMESKEIDGYKIRFCSLADKKEDPFRDEMMKRMTYVELYQIYNHVPLVDYIPPNIKRLKLIHVNDMIDLNFWKLLDEKKLDYLEISTNKWSPFILNETNLLYVTKVISKTEQIYFGYYVWQQLLRYPELYEIAIRKSSEKIWETLVLDHSDISDRQIDMFVNNFGEGTTIFISDTMNNVTVVPRLFMAIRNKSVKINELGLKSWYSSYDQIPIDFTTDLRFWNSSMVPLIKDLVTKYNNIKQINTGFEALTEEERENLKKFIHGFNREIGLN